MWLLLGFKGHIKPHITQETKSSSCEENNITKMFAVFTATKLSPFPNSTCSSKIFHMPSILSKMPFSLLSLCLLSSYLSLKTHLKWSSSQWRFHWLWPGFHCPMLVNLLKQLWQWIIIICSDVWEPHSAESVQISSSPEAHSRPKTLPSKHNSILTNLLTHSNLSGLGSRLYKHPQLENQIRHHLRFVVNHCFS